jgi:putative FmdB family regulatory protein
MPLYEYYCKHCHGIFEEFRQMTESSQPSPCPECDEEAPRIMSSFAAFTMRDGYPRRIPDKGTYWHMGQEVKTRATRLVGNTHPELLKPKPRARPTRGDVADRADKTLLKRSDALYKDKWGVTPDGRRSVKAKKVKPARKVV